MIVEERGRPYECRTTESKFPENRNSTDDEFYVDRIRKADSTEIVHEASSEEESGNEEGDDEVNLFLQDREDWIPSRKVEHVKIFCRPVRKTQLICGAGTASTRVSARLDDAVTRRGSSKHRHDRTRKSLSATQLYHFLKENVWHMFKYNSG
jgi:hypothetical protein